MKKLPKVVFVVVILAVVTVQSTMAYDIPQRKIEIKPYLNLAFPSDFWEKQSQPSLVENKMAFGAGVKVRTQFSNQLGIAINTAYSRFDVLEGVSNDGLFLTLGGYYAKSYDFGNLTFDFGYGIVIAADEVLGLLMPSIEYSRPVSERMSVALEIGLPVPNDWPKNFDYKEKIGSFTLSAGTVFVF